MARFGVWKPRTRPNSFEGIGEQALAWIAEVRQDFPTIKTTIEVSSAAHVKLALKQGIDVLWIGARTTVNPFLVQEIADAVGEIRPETPVMVKNPVNPDLELWVGAIERLRASGVLNLAAVHRGFSSYKPEKYRNPPQWQIPIEFQNRMPDVPLICDPSHITGNRLLVAEVAQKALDLMFDGLMIEAHPAPDHALSDPDQQVALSALGELIGGLHVRREKLEDSSLAGLREQINDLDRELISILGKRSALINEIGKIKNLNNVAIYQPERWKEIIRSRPEWGAGHGLSRRFVEGLYRLIHDESIRKQNLLMKGDEGEA